VLDVACGPGHITQRIKTITQGRVVGTDISAGMIVQAHGKYPAIAFRHLAAESLDYEGVRCGVLQLLFPVVHPAWEGRGGDVRGSAAWWKNGRVLPGDGELVNLFQERGR